MRAEQCACGAKEKVMGARGIPILLCLALLGASAALAQEPADPMAARLSADGWPDATGVAAQAESLRERATRLVDEVLERPIVQCHFG